MGIRLEVSRVSERRWPWIEACTARHRERKCNLDECGPAVGIAGAGARTLGRLRSQALTGIFSDRSNHWEEAKRALVVQSFHTSPYSWEETYLAF